MSAVNVHNEWDPLEEIIIGVATGAQVPLPGPDLYSIEYFEHHADESEIPSGPYPQQVIEETEEDLSLLVAALESEGVTVRRPNRDDVARPFGSPDWQSDGEYHYTPRDVLLAIGETLIETPMPLRSRFFEINAYRDILVDYFESGANWISAPPPRLLDATYADDPGPGNQLHNIEPLFDAANVLRCGRDILYLVSCSGNRMGGEWLQRVLGDEYRVHLMDGVYDGTHVDTTITLIRPGLVMLNPSRVTEANMPDIFRSWDVIWCPEMIDTGYVGAYPRASQWSGMNFFMVNPELAVVNEEQRPLIEALARHGVDCLELPLRHCLTLSGGFHCVSLDVRRRGTLEDYSS